MNRDESVFADDIQEAAGDEFIVGIVVGDFQGAAYENEREPHDCSAIRGQVVSWERARPLLMYAYDTGFGGAECHAIYAWTLTRVLFVREYDGSTSMGWVPREPGPCDPSTEVCT